jgi:hypothetical protein
MQQPASAFFLIAVLIWLLRGWRRYLAEPAAEDAPWRRQEEGR